MAAILPGRTEQVNELASIGIDSYVVAPEVPLNEFFCPAPAAAAAPATHSSPTRAQRQAQANQVDLPSLLSMALTKLLHENHADKARDGRWPSSNALALGYKMADASTGGALRMGATALANTAINSAVTHLSESRLFR